MPHKPKQNGNGMIHNERPLKQLKMCFWTAPVFMQPDRTKPFHLSTDTSLVTIGVVLEQVDDNGDVHPCASYR